jgi:predicted nuclease of predicted toxin-antitoxin system
MQGAAGSARMLLLIDENGPSSVAKYFVERGHDVKYVRDLLPAGTPDPVVATIGDQLSAIVVTWDRDFERIVERVPAGNRRAFRRLGRISFRCNEAQGRTLLERWIAHIEFHYAQAQQQGGFSDDRSDPGKRLQGNVSAIAA